MVRCIVFIFSFQFSVVYTLAQQPDLYFKKINTENGLSNNIVKCILQDKRGFIWVGTEDGLNRFDGARFVVFRHQPNGLSGISGNIITDMLEDKNGVIWIATEDGGLNRYDHRLPPKEQFRQFKHRPDDPASIPVNFINSILEDSYENIWLATSGASVLRFNKKTQKFDYRVNVGRTVYDLCQDKNGIIWAGRQGGSILKINPLNGAYKVQKEYENFYQKLPHVVVTTLFRDSEENMWFGSWDKALYRYNNVTQKEEIFTGTRSPYAFANDEAISFNEDPYQRIWIGGRYNGLYVYDKKTNRFYNHRHDPSRDGSLASNTINCIFTDRSGNVWLGTGNGLSVNVPFLQQFTQVFLPRDAGNPGQLVVYDFFKNNNGALWIGTSAGLFIQNPATGISHHKIFFNKQLLQVTKFFRDETGEMYLGTDYSFFKFDTLTKKVISLPNTGKDVVMKKLIESRIVSVVKDTIDNNPALIVSPYGHFIAYYDLIRQVWVSRQDSSQMIQQKYDIRDNLVRRMVHSATGKIWLANLKEGLGEWDATAGMPIRYYSNNPQSFQTITNNNVYDITEDGNHNLWVSTYGGGLNYFYTASGKFSHIRSSNNLLEGIRLDTHGNVWMIGNGNLHRYDTANGSYTSFIIPDIEHSGGVRGYLHEVGDGKMYMAGNNYFIAFHPDSVKEMKAKPDVKFTDFTVFNESFSDLLFKEKIVLQHDQNFFTLQFAAPYFSGGGNMQYSYMLEGVDKNWVIAATNTASYTNISGGVYRFKVRATTNPGVWSNQYSFLYIEVVPPFWKRWWFYLICALLCAGIIYGVYRYRINELLKRQAMRNKIAQDLHDNVGSTLSSISIYSQVAQIQSRQHNEIELVKVLDKIGVTSNEMISEMNDIVWTINPRNDNMEKILQRMDSYAKPLLAAKNIRFIFDYDASLLHYNLDMGRRKNFYLIFKETINNAVKYADCKHISVHITTKKNTIQLTINDDGAGFNTDKLQSRLADSLSGNGLRNMALRAKEMKGQCVVYSEPGKGTTVSLGFSVT